MFFEGGVTDKWFKGDHKLRKFIKRILRKPVHFSSGVDNWFLNLCEGLKQNGIKFTVNDYKNLKKSINPVAVVIAPEKVLDKIPSHIPIIYGPGICSHPSLLNWEKYNIKRLIIPCNWLAEMYKRDLPVQIPFSIQPIGIKTDIWCPLRNSTKDLVIVYDKVRWEREIYETDLINPIIEHLVAKFDEKVKILKYGNYKESDFLSMAQNANFMVFLCEHETQGFAYQQALSCDVPIFAWDRGGLWKDPLFYPDKVNFEPVTSVPYWDDSCGSKFQNFDDYLNNFNSFYELVKNDSYKPRNFILNKLSIKGSARDFKTIIDKTIQLINEDLCNKPNKK